MRSFSFRTVASISASTMFAIAILGSASAARADVYTSASAFAAITSGITTVNFGNLPSGGYANNGPAYDGGITITSASPIVHVNSGDFYTVHGSLPTYPGGDYIIVSQNSPLDTVTISFPSSTAFSIDLGGTFSSGGPESFGYSYAGGSGVFVASDYVTSGLPLDFFGLTSTTPFTSVTFSIEDNPAIGAYGTFDNVAYGTANTPEPGSLTLLGTGLLGVGALVRRRFKQ